MSAAPASSADLSNGTDPAASGPQPVAGARMDRAFVVNHQIVERYLAGRLPRKGAQDFEQFCREHPELLEEIGLGEHLQAALRLLEAGGHAPPWEEKPVRWWQQLPALIGAVGVAVGLAIVSLTTAAKLSAAEHQLTGLRAQLAAQPLNPAETTRPIILIPSRTAPSQQSLVTLGGATTELDELKIDMGWSKFKVFDLTVDRVDQGRVAVIRDLQRDSNGDLRLELNSSALGPGDYQFTIDGLTWSGAPVAQAWATITIAH